MLERLRSGDFGGVLDILFRYPEHPGFKIFGLGPAALQQALHPGQPISDMRQASGEWLTAFVFSLSAVCAIGLTYAVGRRAGASERESLLAAFLMFASTSMLMYARHFFPYDLALALGLLATWVALSPSDRVLDSIGAGLLAGAAFSTVLRLLAAGHRRAGPSYPLAPGAARSTGEAPCPGCRRIRDRARPAGRGQRPAQPITSAAVAPVSPPRHSWRGTPRVGRCRGRSSGRLRVSCW